MVSLRPLVRSTTTLPFVDVVSSCHFELLSSVDSRVVFLPLNILPTRYSGSMMVSKSHMAWAHSLTWNGTWGWRKDNRWLWIFCHGQVHGFKHHNFIEYPTIHIPDCFLNFLNHAHPIYTLVSLSQSVLLVPTFVSNLGH